jgi:hypothetical protein
MSKPAGENAEVKEEVKEIQVLNLPELITMSGGPSAEKFVNKFISTFEVKSLNDTVKNMHTSWLNNNKQQLEFYSHKAKGASLQLCAQYLSKISTEMNTYLKGLKGPMDKDLIDNYYGDFLVEAKNLKVKIAEHVNKPPEVNEINEYSRIILRS